MHSIAREIRFLDPLSLIFAVPKADLCTGSILSFFGCMLWANYLISLSLFLYFTNRDNIRI